VINFGKAGVCREQVKDVAERDAKGEKVPELGDRVC